MMIISNNKMSIGSYCTINKLIIIRIGCNNIKLVVGRHEQSIWIINDDIQCQSRKSSCCLLFQDLSIFSQYLCRDTQLVTPI